MKIQIILLIAICIAYPTAILYSQNLLESNYDCSEMHSVWIEECEKSKTKWSDRGTTSHTIVFIFSLVLVSLWLYFDINNSRRKNEIRN